MIKIQEIKEGDHFAIAAIDFFREKIMIVMSIMDIILFHVGDLNPHASEIFNYEMASQSQ